MSSLIILAVGGDSITGCGQCYPYQGLGVVSVGDCGSSVTLSPFQYYYSSGTNLIAKVLAVSGTRLKVNADNMTTVAQTYADTMVTPSGSSVGGGGITSIPPRKYIFSLLAGSSDGCLDGDVPTFVADIVTFCAARKTAGFNKVILGTVLPRTDGAMIDANRVTYNSTITANGWAAANGIDGIFDLAGDSIMGNIANTTNATYYNSDQIHPTPAGHARLAPIWLTTLTAAIAGL